MCIAKKTGIAAEDKAVEYLKKIGYKIIARNFNTKFGELDIVAKDKRAVVFAEVKFRKNLQYGLPHEFVTRNKAEKLKKAAWVYIKQNNISNTDLRFDVISIADGEIEHFKNAFA